LAALTLLAALGVGSSPAHALGLPMPWDGVNPFNCTVQDAGLNTTGPDPAADPYCVRFDKTHQNVTQLGIVEFLLKEPGRTAAALDKCFYYQEDHWRGSLVQNDGRTVLYEFTGHYFFDEATADGGVWVTGFNVAGVTVDPTSLPGFPPSWGKYFGPGTGGVITHDQIPGNPVCVARAAKAHGTVYADRSESPHCVAAIGPLGRHGIGPVALGETEDRVRAALGPPGAVRRGFLRYCASRGGEFLIGQVGDRSGTLGSGGHDLTVIVLTTSRAVLSGTSKRALLHAFPHARRLLRLRGGTDVMRVPGTGIFFGVRRGTVRYLGVYDTSAVRGARSLAGYLQRAS
jgi:hypothetical protein